MNYESVVRAMLAMFPNAMVEEDELGEIVISTRMYLEDGKVLPLVECTKCSEWTPDQWGGLCHDCDNQSCPECGSIDCDHEF